MSKKPLEITFDHNPLNKRKKQDRIAEMIVDRFKNSHLNAKNLLDSAREIASKERLQNISISIMRTNILSIQFKGLDCIAQIKLPQPLGISSNARLQQRPHHCQNTPILSGDFKIIRTKSPKSIDKFIFDKHSKIIFYRSIELLQSLKGIVNVNTLHFDKYLGFSIKDISKNVTIRFGTEEFEKKIDRLQEIFATKPLTGQIPLIIELDHLNKAFMRSRSSA